MGEFEKTQNYVYLNRYSTPELELLLRADLDAPDGGDDDMALYIMEVIAQREQGDPAEEQAESERALREFYQHYYTPEGEGESLYPVAELPKEESMGDAEASATVAAPRVNHPFQLRRFLVVAAIIACFASILVPTAIGRESIFEMLGLWSPEVFSFSEEAEPASISENNRRGIPEESPGETLEYQSLEEALSDYGIEEDVFPAQFLEGFELGELSVSDKSEFGRIEFYAFYDSSENSIAVSVVKYYSPKSQTYEKSDAPMEEYEANGTIYYLFENNGKLNITWYIDNLECGMSTDMKVDELKSKLSL